MKHIISVVSDWYFSRKALPYWGMLCIDCTIVMFSRYLAKYLEVGGLVFARHFWAITHGLLLWLIFFMVAFRIFRTYSGVVRYSSFVDLKRIAFATVVGSFLTWILGLMVNHSEIITYIFIPSIRVKYPSTKY